MAEKRARDLSAGQKIRQIGDVDDVFHKIVGYELRGDDVLIDVEVVPGAPPYSLPVLDGDEVLEVEE